MTRINLSPRTPRSKELLSLSQDSARETRFVATRSDRELCKLDNTAKHLVPSAALPEENMSIIDDLAVGIPMTNHELDVIETYLGSLLDAMLVKK